MPATSGKRQRRLPSSADGQTSQDYSQRSHPMEPTASRRRTQLAINGTQSQGQTQDGGEGEDLKVTGHISNVPQYRTGNLIRVEMTNFLTFSKTVFKPGPRMNLVIGPNGTGKSTIVSAVCIVFGGKPSILGRNPDLAAFVKYGTTKSTIEARIYDPSHEGGYVTVRREFDTDGHGAFYIDDRRCKIKDINEKIVHKYDIQLDNLSQFMPQEKVAEFTNHKPEELLKLAIRSLGGVDKEEEYFKLVEEDVKLLSHTDSLKKNKEMLERLSEEQENDSEEVAAYRQQQELREKLDILKRLRPALNEIDARIMYKKFRDQVKELDAEVNVLENELRERMTGPVNIKKQTLDNSKAKYSSAKSSVSRCDNHRSELSSAVDQLSLKLAGKMKEFRDVKTHAEKARKCVELAEAKLKQAEEAYGTLSRVSDEDLKGELDQLENTRRELRDNIRNAERNIGPMEHDMLQVSRKMHFLSDKLERLKDVRQQRMNRVRQMRDGDMILKLADLVGEMTNGNAFERNVYGPVMAEIEVNDDYHARIIQHCVSGWLATAFVFESMKDNQLFLNECKRKFNIRPDTMTTPTTRDDQIDHETIRRQIPSVVIDDNLKRLGIECTVSNIFKAPDAVKYALNANAGLHNVYVGNQSAVENTDTLRFHMNIPAWYTPEFRCSVSKSRYDSRVRNLKMDSQFYYVKGELYKGSMSETREKEQYLSELGSEEHRRKEIQGKLEQLKSEQYHVHGEMRKIQNEIVALSGQRKARRDKWDEVEYARRHLEAMENRAQQRDEGILRERLGAVVVKFENNVMEGLYKLRESANEVANGLEIVDDAMIDKVCAERELAEEEMKHTDLKRSWEEKKMDRDGVRQQREDMKREWKERKQNALRAMTPEEAEQHKDKLMKYVEQHDDAMKHLDNDIDNLEGQIQGLSVGGGIIEQYELRERKIEKLKKEIEKQEDWFERRHSDLIGRKEGFRTWLEEGIGRMRRKFSSLYKRLGCSGDIRLLNNVPDCNLKDLTLQILVSYRNDVELRPVSAQANSGGEKMCCTMIFCFSLQLEEERIPPFIMVDELNQGLDPSNEMKIMTMMIEDAAKDSGPQSFVVTPKLLSNLPLSSCTKTHIVFNGPVKGKENFLSDF